MIWTPELSAKCLALSQDGFSASQIQAQLGVPGLSRNAVIGKIHRAGLSVGGGKRTRLAAKKDPSNVAAIRVSVTAIRAKREKAAAPVVPLPKPKPASNEFLGIALAELTEDTCRYQRGDGPFLFCGQPVQTGSSYCPHCHAICWQPRDRSRDKVRAA